jgi:hypothetical protein
MRCCLQVEIVAEKSIKRFILSVRAFIERIEGLEVELLLLKAVFKNGIHFKESGSLKVIFEPIVFDLPKPVRSCSVVVSLPMLFR